MSLAASGQPALSSQAVGTGVRGTREGSDPELRIAMLIRDHGHSVVVILVAAMAIAGTIAPALGFLTLPRDTLEGFLWGRAFQWGYFKHPPLQAWILGGLESLWPGHVWVAYALAQGCMVVTMVAVWRLASAALGREQAVLASLLTLLGVHYLGPSMATFTPDTLSVPLWALTGLFWWRAVVESRERAWFALGVVVALSIYAKYVGLLLLGLLALYTIATVEGRKQLRTPAPWVAMTVCAVLVMPHLVWMVDTGFAPLGHAVSYDVKASSIAERIWFCVLFLSAQVMQHAGLLLLLGVCIGIGRWAPAPAIVFDGPVMSRFRRDAILVMAVAPIAVALATNFAVGGEFRQGRAMALFAFSGIAAVMLLGPRILVGNLRFATVVAGVVVIGLPFGNAFHHHARLALGATEVPTLIPAQALADQLNARWQDRFERPLTIVVGDRWHAGNVAFYASDQPQIFLDADPRQAPWVDEARLREEGGLIVWSPTDRRAKDVLRRRFPGLVPEGQVTAPSPLAWGKPSTLSYAFIVPGGAAAVQQAP